MRVNVELDKLQELLADIASDAKDEARIEFKGAQADAVTLGIAFLLEHIGKAMEGLEDYDLSPETEAQTLRRVVERFCLRWCEHSQEQEQGGLRQGAGGGGVKAWQGDGWEIHCGRWEDSAPDVADVILGDPGYDEATHEGHELDVRDRGVVGFEPACPEQITQPLLDMSRRWVVLFCAFEQLGDYKRAAGGMRKAGGGYVRGGAWVKSSPAPQMSGDRPGQWGEGIAIMHPSGGSRRWAGGGCAGVWFGPSARGDERLHQTPKPLWLMLRLVEDFTEPGELVFDPYCGSGTTGVACLRLGRRFVGCEIQPHYAEIAAHRLEAEARGLTLQDVRRGQTSIMDLLSPAGRE